MNVDLLTDVRSRASDPTKIHDYAQWMPGRAKIFAPATPKQIRATVNDLGFELPSLFKEILSMIGNGGFGPGYGLIGVQGGYVDFKRDGLLELGRQLGALEKKIVPICNWGCGIYSCLDCAKSEAPVLFFNPQIDFFGPENILQVTVTSSDGTSRYRQAQAPRAAPGDRYSSKTKIVLAPKIIPTIHVGLGQRRQSVGGYRTFDEMIPRRSRWAFDAAKNPVLQS